MVNVQVCLSGSDGLIRAVQIFTLLSQKMKAVMFSIYFIGDHIHQIWSFDVLVFSVGFISKNRER